MIDALIILFIIFSVYRGREIGFVRQAFSTVGFFAGLFLGAWLQPNIVSSSMNQAERSLLSLLTTLGCALVLMTVGEYLGILIKKRAQVRKINKFDNGLGSVLAIVSLLFSVWLLAAILNGIPFSKLNAAVQRSYIVSALNRSLPDAPTFISGIAHLIDPNGFPQVFTGNEPTPRTDINLPALGEMRPAVEQTRDSVVKIEGEGCGGVVDGSGYVVRPGFVATNAHVVAGIAHPYVQDVTGRYKATTVWFDPDLDFAVLRVPKMTAQPLVLATGAAAAGTPAVVLGYPNGGNFNVSLAAVLDQFTATGRNIYDRGNTERDIYEVRAKVVPGNSGGPLINKEGKVIGTIFAQSTSHEGIGYALTNSQTRVDIAKAVSRDRAVSSGQCAAD